MTKRCNACTVTHPVSSFYRKKGRLASECKSCQRDRIRKWRAKRDADPQRLAEWKAHRREYFSKTVNGGMHRVYRRVYLSAKRSKKVFLLTVTDLVDLFHEQAGRCALTGRVMSLPNKVMMLDSVSVDRKDNTLGYIKGNIRLVTTQSNIARAFGSDRDLASFCADVLRYARQNIGGPV